MRFKSLLGGPIGDIVGSVYEDNPIRVLDFPLFIENSRFTDDTVMTVAIADWLLNKKDLIKTLQNWGLKYRNRGYGWNFYCWLKQPMPKPYNSWGNGSAMRASAIGYYANSIEETLSLAEQSAIVSHNHPEGVKGAQAIALSVFMAAHGASKDCIKNKIETFFNYNLSRKCDEIRENYRFESSCQKSCPESIIAFLESTDFEHAIRLAVSLGGDADTLGCMTGSIASAFYGIPTSIYERTLNLIPEDLYALIKEFDERIIRHNMKILNS